MAQPGANQGKNGARPIKSRGRPRKKPEHVKLFPQGTNPAEPIPMPDDLSELEQKYWKKYAPMAHGFGLLTPIDEEQFRILVEAWAMAHTATMAIRLEGATLEMMTGKKRNPEVQVWTSAWSVIDKLTREFGLTPLARAVLVPRKDERVDKEFDLKPEPVKPKYKLHKAVAKG